MRIMRVMDVICVYVNYVNDVNYVNYVIIPIFMHVPRKNRIFGIIMSGSPIGFCDRSGTQT